MLAPLAGGWHQAALLPLLDALAWADEALREKRWQAHEKAVQIWASTLPAYAMGGTPPDPPEPPED
jgi:hypothetical protein